MDESAPEGSAVGVDEQAALRRMPSQRRSRERVERILTCAAGLIAEVGSDAMRMSEVARLAGVSIGSLYQYFPDKSAILRTLAERYNAVGRACIAEALERVQTPTELCDAFVGLVDTYHGIFLAEPVMRDIWGGAQADKTLRDLEIAASRANGALLAGAMARVHPGSDPAALATAAFLIMHLGEETMRVAVSLPRDEGDALVAAYKRMALAELRREGAVRRQQ
jgi:AcrR family transcriptional regulator